MRTNWNVKIKISWSFIVYFQDAQTERPSKRLGSSTSEAESSPATSNCSISPQFPASCSSLPLSSDDEEPLSRPQLNDKTYTISAGGPKMSESSTLVGAAQRDSQTVYSSSFKCNVDSKTNKSVPVEVVPSPADSSATNEVSEVSDFDAITDLDRAGYVSSPNDYSNIFSPLEPTKLSEENVMLINKGDKTPHTLKKRPTNNICYK